MADGWLTATVTPEEAGAGRAVIEAEAAQLGRVVDAEHFGISIPFGREAPPESSLTLLRKRRKDGDLDGVLAVGGPALRDLVSAHIDQGLSKFVVRPAYVADPYPLPDADSPYQPDPARDEGGIDGR